MSEVVSLSDLPHLSCPLCQAPVFRLSPRAQGWTDGATETCRQCGASLFVESDGEDEVWCAIWALDAAEGRVRS